MNKGLIVHTLLLNDENKILIMRRAKKNDVLAGCWDVPGGTLEDGEDPYIGAQREVKEEAGLSIDTPQLYFSVSNVDTDKNKQFITLLFFSKYPGGDINLNPEEHDRYEWVSLSEVKKYQVVKYLSEAASVLARVLG